MIEAQPSESATAPRPRILKVILLILLACLLFSYLISYAGINLLCNSGLLPPLSHETDPRPKWMLIAFAIIVTVISVSAIAMRWTGSRQLLEIDEMANAQENPEDDS